MTVRGGRRAASAKRRPQAARRQQGSVLLLAIVLSAVLAMLATAFIITARVERRAATNALRGAQAESACRAGLAAAVYRIELVCESVYGLDAADSWHSYFEGGASDPSLCPPDTWVNHYNGEKFSNNAVHACRMAGKRFLMPIAASGDPAATLKRQKGFTAEYYVAVADLDGKLHVNPNTWSTTLKDNNAALAAIYKPLLVAGGLADARAQSLADINIVPHTSPLWSLGQMRLDFALSNADEMRAAESFLTTYPPALPANTRPAVNVNTARWDVLKAIVLNVPGLTADMAKAVADKLVGKRPFSNREEMEKALVELGDPNWKSLPAGYVPADNKLSEKLLNNLLNSLAGTNSANESVLDQASAPGLYKYDFDDETSTKRDETGDTDATKPDDTWGTEVKFTSRFYHIYVLARTLSGDSPPRVTAERRLHAVYDADPGTRRVLWLRWNFAAKANMSD